MSIEDARDKLARAPREPFRTSAKSEQFWIALNNFAREVQADIPCVNRDRGGCPASHPELCCVTCNARWDLLEAALPSDKGDR